MRRWGGGGGGGRGIKKSADGVGPVGHSRTSVYVNEQGRDGADIFIARHSRQRKRHFTKRHLSLQTERTCWICCNKMQLKEINFKITSPKNKL